MNLDENDNIVGVAAAAPLPANHKRAAESEKRKKGKRGRNEGTIFKRSDGRWCAVIDLGWENGHRRRKYLYGGTRTKVAAALNKALQETAQGLPIAFERQTVAVFLRRWLEDSVKPSVRPLTYQQYHQHVRLYLKPVLGTIGLEKLRPQHVQAFLNEKLKTGLSPRTVQLSLVILRHALDQAVKWGLAARNVAKLVDSPKVERPETQYLSPEEARQFLNAAKGERLEALYSVALALGVRQGEALGLRWKDIDLEARTLMIRQAVERIGGKRFGAPGKLLFVEPKTDRSRRTIVMPENIVRALRLHRTRQIEQRLVAGSAWRENGLVFTTSIGTPIDPRETSRDFKRILVKAKLSASLRFHDLRHSAASLLLAQGVELRAIMELLGHSTIALTANTYSHVLPSLKREMADAMDVLLWEQG